MRALGCFFLCCVLGSLWLTARRLPPPPPAYHSRPAIASYILTLDPDASSELAEAVGRHLTTLRPTPWRALNGSQALAAVELPLYTRLALVAGRHDHMQIGTPEMLACLLGHMAIWREIGARNLTQALVLEEDAFVDGVSGDRFAQLLVDVSEAYYDVLLLETGHLTVSGAAKAVGELGRAWVEPSDALRNRWMGTRGYLVRASALPRLLRHAETLDVQVDAVLTLAAVFDGLRLLWTTQDIAQPSRLRRSRVQSADPCLKCFVSPVSAHAAVGALGALFMAAGLGAWASCRQGSTLPPCSPPPPSSASATC